MAGKDREQPKTKMATWGRWQIGRQEGCRGGAPQDVISGDGGGPEGCGLACKTRLGGQVTAFVQNPTTRPLLLENAKSLGCGGLYIE